MAKAKMTTAQLRKAAIAFVTERTHTSIIPDKAPKGKGAKGTLSPKAQKIQDYLNGGDDDERPFGCQIMNVADLMSVLLDEPLKVTDPDYEEAYVKRINLVQFGMVQSGMDAENLADDRTYLVTALEGDGNQDAEALEGDGTMHGDVDCEEDQLSPATDAQIREFINDMTDMQVRGRFGFLEALA